MLSTQHHCPRRWPRCRLVIICNLQALIMKLAMATASTRLDRIGPPKQRCQMGRQSRRRVVMRPRFASGGGRGAAGHIHALALSQPVCPNNTFRPATVAGDPSPVDRLGNANTSGDSSCACRRTIALAIGLSEALSLPRQSQTFALEKPSAITTSVKLWAVPARSRGCQS